MLLRTLVRLAQLHVEELNNNLPIYIHADAKKKATTGVQKAAKRQCSQGSDEEHSVKRFKSMQANLIPPISSHAVQHSLHAR